MTVDLGLARFRYDPSAKSCLSPAIVRQNRMRDGRRWRVFIPCDSMTSTLFAASTSSALESAGTDRAWVVHAQEERTVDLLLRTIQADGLTDAKDVPFVEGLLERRARDVLTSEGNPLRPDNQRVRRLGVVGR